jgi:MtN3 and saliva related transmembrane protein
LSFGDILGLVAGAITTGSLVPQVIRVFRLKTSREISLYFTILFIVGDSAWLFYGIYFKLMPVVLWNVLAIILAFLLLIGKLKYDSRAGGLPDIESSAKEK